jgi:hypothetical protein
MSLARQITKQLGGDWHGRYGLLPGPGHSGNDRSLKVSAHASDINDVLLHSFAGDDVLAIKQEWRKQGLLPRRDCAHAINPAEAEKAKIERQKLEADEEAKRRSTAVWLWDRTRPAAGTIIETAYLPARGIHVTPPSTMRYLAPDARNPHPAMVCAFGLAEELEPGILSITREAIAGIHLTYLRADGKGKAAVDPTKRMIGRSKGWPIVLAPPNDLLGLAIAEGIENALSHHEATGLGAWAAGAANRLPNLVDRAPEYIERVTLITDDDPAGRKGAQELAARLSERGFEVSFLFAGGWE